MERVEVPGRSPAVSFQPTTFSPSSPLATDLHPFFEISHPMAALPREEVGRRRTGREIAPETFHPAVVAAESVGTRKQKSANPKGDIMSHYGKGSIDRVRSTGHGSVTRVCVSVM